MLMTINRVWNFASSILDLNKHRPALDDHETVHLCWPSAGLTIELGAAGQKLDWSKCGFREAEQQ